MKDLQLLPVRGQKMIETVASLAGEIWKQHFTPILGEAQVGYMVEHFQSVPALNKQLSEGYEYFLLTVDGKPVGYSGIHDEGDGLFLSKLYIHKSCRGNKISSQTIAFLKILCRQRDLKRIWLTCNKHNDNTLAIYRHLGFETIDAQVTDIGCGFVMDDYIMELVV